MASQIQVVAAIGADDAVASPLRCLLLITVAPADIPKGAVAFERLNFLLRIQDLQDEWTAATIDFASLKDLTNRVIANRNLIERATGSAWGQQILVSSDQEEHPLRGVSLTTSCLWALFYFRLADELDPAFAQLTAIFAIATIRLSKILPWDKTYTAYLQGKTNEPLGSRQSAFFECGLAIRKLSSRPFHHLLLELGRFNSITQLRKQISYSNRTPGLWTEDELDIMRRIGSFLDLAFGKRDVQHRRGQYKARQIEPVVVKHSVVVMTESDSNGDNTQTHYAQLQGSQEDLEKFDIHPTESVKAGLILNENNFSTNQQNQVRPAKKKEARDWHIAETNRISAWLKSSLYSSDLTTIMHLLSFDNPQLSAGKRPLATLALFSLSFGRPSAALDVVRYNVQSAQPVSDIEVLIAERQVRFLCPHPQDKTRLSDSEAAVSRPMSEYLLLPIPDQLWDHISDMWDKGSVIGDYVFPVSIFAGLDKKLSTLLNGCELSQRITPARLVAPLRQAILAVSPDHATQSILTGAMSVASHASLHYFSPPASAMYEIYVESAKHLRLTFSDARNLNAANAHLGSLRCPSTSIVQATLTELRARIASSSALYDFHNAYMSYTHFVVSVALSLRASIENRWQAKDLNNGLVIYGDKDDEFNYHRRLMVLAPTALHQLRQFEQYRTALLQSVPHMKSVPKCDLDYFFAFDSHGRPSTYQPQDVRSQTIFVLPVNSVRRLFQTHSWERGATGEEIGVMMGHWWRGREPWADTACIAPLPYLTELAARFVEPLLVEIGASVVEIPRAFPWR